MPVTARLGVATAVTVVTGLLSVGVFVPAAVAADPATGTMLVAHRGSSVNAPENTLAAFDRAVAEHADRMSLDVHLTKDGVPVVIHDGTLTRTTDAKRRFPGSSPWSVGALTLAQVRTLDAGSWFGDGAFTGIRVPTLDEVLTELGPSPTGLTVEIKTPAVYGGAARIGKAVMDVIRAHPEWASSSDQEQPRLVVESFDWSFLDDLHVAYPSMPLALLHSADVTAADLAAHPYVKELDVEWRALTPGAVAAAHAKGIRVGTWTPNETGALS